MGIGRDPGEKENEQSIQSKSLHFFELDLDQIFMHLADKLHESELKYLI